MLSEIVVGNKEELGNYQISKLNESFGNLKTDRERSIIIKVPKDYN